MNTSLSRVGLIAESKNSYKGENSRTYLASSRVSRKERMSTIIDSEYQECLWLVEYLDILKRMGKVKLYSHIPNSTYTQSWAQKTKNRLLGVNKGVPDYFILFPTHAITVEMKRTKGGVLSPEQKEWIENLNKVNIRSFVAKGFVEAKVIIDKEIQKAKDDIKLYS